MVQLNRRDAAQGAAPRLAVLSATVALLGACAAFGPPDIETTRAFQNVGPDRLYERTLQTLQASGLEVTETDPARGVITAAGETERERWAECTQPRRLVQDADDQQHLVGVPVDYRRVELTASVSAAPQGARLTLDPAFFAEPVSALATTEECRTTGVLERRILEAVAQQAT